jgi:DNA-binding NarL/FixJ family response regulator
MVYEVYLVDDHPVVRRGYVAVIEGCDDFQVCGEADSGFQALEDMRELAPDLVIVDIAMDGMNGIELIKRIRSEWTGLPILVISVHDEEVYAERVLAVGANGYLRKDETGEALLDVMRAVVSGGLYVSEHISNQIVLRNIGRDSGASSPLDQLSDRELEVFEHIGQGLSTKEIADAMFISPKTVGTHRRHIKEKLAIETNAQLQKRAVLWVRDEA